MPPNLDYLWVPLLACLVLTGVHAWFGIHVLARGVIFVDLALAQIAALGSVVALSVGIGPGTTFSYSFALAFTLFGALVFAWSRVRDERVPQEAIIGIVFAVASAASVVLLSGIDDIHGVEKIRSTMTGRSIIFVNPSTVLETASVYAAVAALHFCFRRQFLLVSTDPERARAEGLNLPLWDFLFYATFGVVITSSVQIAGVLLVFSFLIVPSVLGTLLARSIRIRLLLGWTSGLLASFLGLFFSYELPSGSVIVVTFGAMLALIGFGRSFRLSRDRRTFLLRSGAILGTGALLLLAVLLPPWADWAGEREAALRIQEPEERSLEAVLRGLLASDPLEREKALAAARAHPVPELRAPLFEAFGREVEPDLKIHLAEEGLRRHDGRYLGGLVELVLSLESPYFRQEAAHLLARCTELEVGGEIGEREVERIRAWWKENRGRLSWDEERHRFVRSR